MPQDRIDSTFNGLATKSKFAVSDIMDKLVELRDESVGYLKDVTERFEKSFTTTKGSDDHLTRIRGETSMKIQSGIISISYATHKLSLCQASVDTLAKLSPDVETLELDFTANLAEEAIKAVYKHAKEQGKESDLEFTVPFEVKQKLAL